MARSVRDRCGMLSRMTKGEHPARISGPLLRVISLGIVGGIALSGCVSGSNPGDNSGQKSGRPSSPSSGQPSPTQAAIQTRYRYSPNQTLQVDALSLGKLSATELKLSLRITNIGGESHVIATDFADIDAKSSNSFSHLILVDGQNLKAYFPSQSKQGTYMEAGFPSSASIDPGQSINVSVFYPAPPASVTKVDISAPAMVPFNDIPISGTATVLSGEPDPRKVPLNPPRIENLTSIADDLNGNKSVDNSGNQTAIRLNTDVLFALNKAKLSAKAKSLLQGVAKQINSASTTTIKVDGYTDNSGNDAINNPLSQRRAEAVAKELKSLVTRKGVTYQTAGHGSGDPVATNDTSEGRQKNRRVTVTIRK